MSLSNFRSYAMAMKLYRSCQAIRAPGYVKDQLMRAALSVPLNLGEGSGKSSPKDRCRFYQIALGSLREVQTLLELHGNPIARSAADQTGAMIFRLVQSLTLELTAHESFRAKFWIHPHDGSARLAREIFQW